MHNLDVGRRNVENLSQGRSSVTTNEKKELVSFYVGGKSHLCLLPSING